ncbi:TldD/PmbA family protein [Veronia pacifica]|uniref:Peptidase C69 n=1 Tax=Veronia pacifica TaxID=1080227 RepID=A0A1C3ESM9_9GAMM|nr:TldD/PmbA family protein [Veronia pacifica]ODA36241.1 hypothetical protein A8L45_01175 [Veronia pacifica]
MPSEIIRKRFLELAPKELDYCSIRFVNRRTESLEMEKTFVLPVSHRWDQGAQITVIDNGGMGFASTSDLTVSGLRRALDRAMRLARLDKHAFVTDFSAIEMPHQKGRYQTPVEIDARNVPLSEKLSVLQESTAQLKVDDTIVDWRSQLAFDVEDKLIVTNHGGEISQQFHFVHAGLNATAFANGEAQTRDTGLGRVVMQGGWELLQDIWFGKAQQLGDQAKELVFADNCPEQAMDLLLTSDQMMLQIHESIGHPIELDRILGDERNFAGTSFVTPEMFGSYQYGSELLNVSFDPTIPHESASYGFDDDGSVAQKAMLIEGGVLKRGLGGTISQQRLGVDGVACSRSDTWRRPPLDRMANLNVEAGDKSMEELIGGIEKGILMNTNRSWSIDDSRNKFQFGCQYGQLIERGELTKVVKNPNYRGISSAFWRNLSAVGDASTFGVHGTPYCGKAEPMQLITVGHASPACVFKNVEVFGG